MTRSATEPPAATPRRRWSKRLSTFGVVIIAALGAVGIGGATHGAVRTYAAGSITCPFLAMRPPDASNLVRFARDASGNGMSLPMAFAVGAQITFQQQGLGALLLLRAPQLDRLRSVPGVSHDDRYAQFLPQLRAMAETRAVDGRLTLQDLVEMKEWVARQVGVAISEPSRIETALLFVRAGGSAETWTVDAEDVFRLLAGEIPRADAVVTLSALERAQRAARWADGAATR